MQLLMLESPEPQERPPIIDVVAWESTAHRRADAPCSHTAAPWLGWLAVGSGVRWIERPPAFRAHGPRQATEHVPAAEADRLKRENDAQRAANQADLDRAAKDRARAEAEKTELRIQLLRQFNAILQTRDTARGLIVNMPDVHDQARFELVPDLVAQLAVLSS